MLPTAQTCHNQVSGGGVFTFLQNHYCVPHVAVQEVSLEVGTRFFLPLAGLHWAPDGIGRSMEGDHTKHGVGLFSVGGPAPYHVEPDGVLPEILLPNLLHTTDSGPVPIYIP